MHSLPPSSSSSSSFSSSPSRFSFSFTQKTIHGEEDEPFRPRKKPYGNPYPKRGQIKARIFRAIIGAVVSTFNCFKGGDEEEEEGETVVTRRAPLAAGDGAYC